MIAWTCHHKTSVTTGVSDIPFFRGATRFLFPQWLLLVMQHSGLFKDRRIPQVQALVYVHDWKKEGDDDNFSARGGEFVFWPEGPDYDVVAYPTVPGGSVFCDGSEMAHATSTYRCECEIGGAKGALTQHTRVTD